MATITIPDWRQNKALIDAQAQLAELEARTADLVAAVGTAKELAETASQTLLETEGLHRAKLASDTELKRARTVAGDALAAVRVREDALETHKRDIERMRVVLPRLERDAKQASKDALHAAYRAAVRALAPALGNACEAHAEVVRIHDEARRLFPWELRSYDPTFPPAAGLNLLDWPRDVMLGPESYDIWRRNADADGLL